MKYLSVLILILITSSVSCSSEKVKILEDPRKDKLTPLSNLLISDEYGLPIAGAKILIGAEKGIPFNDNVLVSGSNGEVEIPAAWVTKEDVTLQAQGYVTTTYKDQMPGPINLRIKQKLGEKKIVHNTKLEDFKDVTPNDGQIDVGLSFPAFYKRQFIDFNLTDYVSLKLDEIKILGQSVNIPSNLGLPRQSEWWGFLRVRLNKPNTSMTFSETGFQKLAAIQARFDLSDMIREVRSQDLEPFSLLELIDFKNGGVTNVNVVENQSDSSKVSLDQFNFDQSFQIAAPNYSPDEILLAMALEKTGSQYFPSDIKPIERGQIKSLKTRGLGDGLVLTLLRSKELESGNAEKVARLSGRIYQQNQTNQIELLPLISPPELTSNGIRINLPLQVPKAVQESGIYLSLSEVTSEDTEGVKYDLKDLLWEYYTAEWADEIILPKWSELPELVPGKRYLWEVVVLGQSAGSPSYDIGPQKLEFTDIFTKNALEFTK